MITKNDYNYDYDYSTETFEVFDQLIVIYQNLKGVL